MTASNVLFACAQIALLVLACAPLPRLLGLRSPGVHFEWWRVAGLAIAAGASLRLIWIAAGVWRLRRLRRQAVEPAAGFDDLSRTIGVTAPILWSRDVAHPVTFG